MDPVIFKIICDKCLNLKFPVFSPPPKEKKSTVQYLLEFFLWSRIPKNAFYFFPFTKKNNV